MYNELIVPSVKNTTLFFTHKVQARKDIVVDWHFHNEFEILIAYDDCRTIFTENTVYHAQAGDILFINRKVPHRTITPRGSVNSMLQFKNPFVRENATTAALQFFDKTSCTTYLFKNGTQEHRRMAGYIHQITDEYVGKRPAYTEFIRGYLLEMTAYLCRLGIIAEPDEQKDLRPVLPALQYMETHYAEPLSLEEISRVMNVDKSHFCRLFKKHTGMTFVEYLNAIRVHEAEKRLTNTDDSITAIAYAVGFSSTAYFIKIFRRYNACTPHKYRKMSQKKRED